MRARVRADHLPFSTSAPLYRPNLNWSVVPKPQKAEQANQAIISYILEHHEGETGIIYTLSRADSENIAKEINANPKCKGKLKAAVCTSTTFSFRRSYWVLIHLFSLFLQIMLTLTTQRSSRYMICGEKRRSRLSGRPSPLTSFRLGQAESFVSAQRMHLSVSVSTTLLFDTSYITLSPNHSRISTKKEEEPDETVCLATASLSSEPQMLHASQLSSMKPGLAVERRNVRHSLTVLERTNPDRSFLSSL